MSSGDYQKDKQRFDFNDSSSPLDGSTPDSTPAQHAGDESRDDQVLEDLLKQTKQRVFSRDSMEVVVEFCRTRSDETELSLELVEGLIRHVLRRLFSKAKIPSGCAEWIAEILYYDPSSRIKLESIWKEALLRAS